MLKASVIIPARNRARVLSAVLDSLGRQSVSPRDYEVVVVDDGSTDGTRERLQRRADPFPLIVERLEGGRGFCPSRPRNRGLEVASGEVAIFLDADVLAGPELVARHLEQHERCPGAAVIGYTYGYALDAVNRTPDVLGRILPQSLISRLGQNLRRRPDLWCDGREACYRETADLADHPAPWRKFWTNNVSVPRRAALEVGGFDEAFVGWGGEDLEFAYRLHRYGLAFQLARRAWGCHCPHPIPSVSVNEADHARNRRLLIRKHPELAPAFSRPPT
jgi:validoxylamine A glucosyltransferase